MVQSLRKTKVVFYQFGTKKLPGKFIGYASEEVEQEGDWIISDWRDIENHIASEVHAKRLKSKEVRVRTLQYAFNLPCADGSYIQEGHAQRQTLFHQGAESIDAGAVSSTLSETRSDSL